MDETATQVLPRALQGYFARTGVALSLSVVGEEDEPLVLVNDAFVRLTGYAREEVAGRNCRFLQGPETTEAQKRDLHDFVHDPGRDVGRFPVLNYRRDGSVFHNLVFMTRLRDHRGLPKFILASQFDMTATHRQRALEENDRQLGRSLTEVAAVGRELGLAMMGSAQLLSDSAALIARMSMDGGET